MQNQFLADAGVKSNQDLISKSFDNTRPMKRDINALQSQIDQKMKELK